MPRTSNNLLSQYSDSGFLSGESLYLSTRFRDIEQLSVSTTGYSRVLKAQRMGKWHVLKCLKQEYTNKKEYQALLQKEFEIGYRLNHPHVIQTIGLEEVCELGVCIVMEYVEGRTLRQAMMEDRWTVQRVISIMQQLGEALDYIHQQQIVHRDVKPENILLINNGDHLKLIDFGFSDADSYAILKQPAGTMRYASPEQQQPGRKIDGRADIYAFGVILHEMPCLNRRMRQIAKRCMDVSPEDRYIGVNDIRWQSTVSAKWWALAVISLLFVSLVVWIYSMQTNTEIIHYRQTTRIVTEHDTIREVKEVPIPSEPQKVYIQSEIPPQIDQFYSWVRGRAFANSAKSMDWMEQKLQTIYTQSELNTLTQEAQCRAKELTEGEMLVKLQKYIDKADPQFAIIFASAKNYLSEGVDEFWTNRANIERLSKMFAEAYMRIQEEQAIQTSKSP